MLVFYLNSMDLRLFMIEVYSCKANPTINRSQIYHVAQSKYSYILVIHAL
jgi:hypothetical protein